MTRIKGVLEGVCVHPGQNDCVTLFLFLQGQDREDRQFTLRFDGEYPVVSAFGEVMNNAVELARVIAVGGMEVEVELGFKNTSYQPCNYAVFTVKKQGGVHR